MTFLPSLAALAAALLLAACAGPAPVGSAAAPGADAANGPLVYAVTARHELLSLRAGRPAEVLQRRALAGLEPGEEVVALDVRAADRQLYLLGRTGRLYTVDTAAAQARPVAPRAAVRALPGAVFGADFEPLADHLRLVSDTAMNLRLDPRDNAVLGLGADGTASDAPLRFVPGDASERQRPNVAAAAFTPPGSGAAPVLYVVDRVGVLAVQGSPLGASASPAVSPDRGTLHTVGRLGLGLLVDASLDIGGPQPGTALLAARRIAEPATHLYRVDLASGRAAPLGIVGNGEPLAGIAIAP